MSELGQLLRKARLEREISLDELQESTKIRKKYLEAIEEGNYKLLPGNFYVRAFIKSYAENVGLDPEEVLSLYANVIPSSSLEDTMAGSAYTKRSSLKTNDRWGKRITTIIVVAFCILIFVIIYYFRENQNNANPVNDQGNPITDKLSSQIQTPTLTPTVTQTSTPIPTNAVDMPQVKLVSSAGGLDTYEVSGTAEINLELSLVTKDDCWYEIDQPDGTSLNKKLVQTGNISKLAPNHMWTFNGSFYLRLGRASAAIVKVNGVIIAVGNSPNPKNFQFNLL